MTSFLLCFAVFVLLLIIYYRYVGLSESSPRTSWYCTRERHRGTNTTWKDIYYVLDYGWSGGPLAVETTRAPTFTKTQKDMQFRARHSIHSVTLWIRLVVFFDRRQTGTAQEERQTLAQGQTLDRRVQRADGLQHEVGQRGTFVDA